MKLGNFQDILNYVEKNDNCFEWQRARSKAGYGQFWNGEKVIYTHRHVAEMFYGKPPKGYQVLHSCDNKPCCNPDHLRWGTAAENNKEARDRIVFKSTKSRGEKHPMAKLTQAQVIEIRARRNNGEILKTLAEDYGVTISAIHLVCTGRNWSNATLES